jgi:lysine biosynthesis protein LysW
MRTAFCPACGRDFELFLPLVLGQPIACPHCQSKFEIVCLEPLELDWHYLEPIYPWDEHGRERPQ